MIDSEQQSTVPPTTAAIAAEDRPSTVARLPEANLPRLVMCFDITVLSLQDLKTIASDLKVPGYSTMTKETLCKVLLEL